MIPDALASIRLSSYCQKKAARPRAVTVGEGNRAAILDKPFSAAAVDTKGNIEKTTVPRRTPIALSPTALAAQPPKPVSFTLYFDSNSTEVAPTRGPRWMSLLKEVGKRQAVEVQVTGHTDRVGNVADNDRLSLQRAEAVRAMLISAASRRPSFAPWAAASANR